MYLPSEVTAIFFAWVVVVKAEANTQAQVQEAALQPSTSYLFDLPNDLILEIIDHLYHYAYKINLGLPCRRAMQALATITLQVPDHSSSPYTKYFQIHNQVMPLPWKINFTTQPRSARKKCSVCERRMTTNAGFWAAFFLGLPEAKQRGFNERGRWDANVMKWCEHGWEGSEGMVLKVHCPMCMHWPLYHKYSGKRERTERKRLILEEKVEREESSMLIGD